MFIIEDSTLLHGMVVLGAAKGSGSISRYPQYAWNDKFQAHSYQARDRCRTRWMYASSPSLAQTHIGSCSCSNVVGWSSSLLNVGHTSREWYGRNIDAMIPGGLKVSSWGPQMSGSGFCLETSAWRADACRQRFSM